MSDFIATAISIAYGPRCPETVEGCPCCEAWAQYDALKAGEARNAELVKALEFYADVSKYPSPLTGGMGALWEDCGQIARAALGGQSNEA